MNVRSFKTSLLAALFVTAAAPAQVPTNVAGAGNVAVGGYDLVAFFTAKRATPGDPSIQAQHGGATYFFASEASKKAFAQSPARYLPQFGGYCAFGVSLGALLPVDIDTWTVQNDRLYLNLNPEVAKLFAKDMNGVLLKADAKWKELEKAPPSATLPQLTNVAGAGNVAVGGYDLVAFFAAKKATPGDPSIRAQHGGATYFFASEASKKAFAQSPAHYLPQFGGYCAFGVSLGALLPVDIDTWTVQNDKLYLNLNPEVAKLFAKDMNGVLLKADAKWKEMQVKTPPSKQ